MKIISICQHCKGKGKRRYLQFFSRKCTHCGGKGRKVTKINNVDKKFKSF